jgi:hypothetical protein
MATVDEYVLPPAANAQERVTGRELLHAHHNRAHAFGIAASAEFGHLPLPQIAAPHLRIAALTILSVSDSD